MPRPFPRKLRFLLVYPLLAWLLLAGKTTEQHLRIGIGLPVGSNLEYADPATLARAIEGRREM